MPDSKLTALTANTTPIGTDLLYLVDDPPGTPLSQKITVQNLLDIGVGLLTKPIVITQGTITADTPQINNTVTWNNSGVVFTGWKLNITKTAADDSSVLFDFQVGSASIFRCGIVNFGLVYTSPNTGGFAAFSTGISGDSYSRLAFGLDSGNPFFGMGNGSGPRDMFLIRDGAAALWGIRSGSQAQVMRIYNTWSSSTSYERLSMDWQTSANLCLLGTEKGSGGGTARALAFMTDATERMRLLATSPVLVMDEADANPGAGDLDASDSMAIYTKGNKLVFAYNLSGTINYLTIPLDGSTTTWTHGTGAP